MGKNAFKKIGIISLSIIAVSYISFLILPFILSPILNGYSDQISKMIKESSEFNVNFDGMRLVTTPKLTIGIKINKIDAFLPTNDKFLEAENFQIKLSLLPILLRKLELDMISADNINLNLKVQKDGKFLLESYIPKSEKSPKTKEPAKNFLKLSNHLPNININKYKISFIDMQTNKEYSIEGDKTRVFDFILDKKIKILSSGKMILDGREQFIYNIKLFNQIMPNVQLNDLVFNPEPMKSKPQEFNFNIIDLFKALYGNDFRANLKADIKTHGNIDDVKIDGLMSVDGLGIAVNNKRLPDSHILLKLNGNKIAVDSDIYTAKNEITHIIGKFKTGKHPNIDMSFKSGAKLNNILEIANSLATSFGINDLQTIKANGYIDADFNIKSDLKRIQSSGYLKIPNANLYYGLYKIAINNINSDVSFDNSMINIKRADFSVLGQPLKIYGTIDKDATANINVIANQLSLKSILLSLGQISLLKENIFNSGTITLNASLKGKLNNLSYLANISTDNINLKNIPTSTSVIMTNSKVKITSDKGAFKGSEITNNLKIINPAGSILVPKIMAIIMPDEIAISPTPVLIDKIKLNVYGKINNYLTEKITMDIKTSGDIQSTLTGDINVKNQKLNLNYTIPKLCTILIPGFAKSKLQAKGDLAITGPMANPYLKGIFIVPYIDSPEMMALMNDMVVNLNGPIAKGTGSLKKFTSGGIVATDINSDFLLKGDNFYLSNINGEAFSGKIKGNIIYNIINGKTTVDLKGSDMNATSSIAGFLGVKNALSGTLDFNAKVSLKGITYEEQVKSLKGNFSFIIADGALGKVGKLENFLNAQNILANSVMRLALDSITSLSTVKNTALFKYIKGDMTFSDGWANISSIKTSGPTMSYYVKGRYNILNSTTNVIVLGRLSSDVVALLGPIGDLSIDKLTSYIPKFGTLTAVIIKSMTTNPAEENIANIPPLSSGDKYNKDFKVVFNGGIESQSSVKSFKWLSDVDTSVFDLKFGIKDVKKQVTQAKDSAVNEAKKQYEDIKKSTVDEAKNTVNDTKKQIQDAAGEWKNLLKF